MGQTAIAGAAAAERIFEILDAESPVRDEGTRTLAPLQRSIRFDQVTFSYDGARTVLEGFDLEIRKGEMVALVGTTGGGKTTVANLLPRFFDPTGGRILVDGVDIREATLASLRDQIAIVTQETVIFHTTVRANIAYGRPGASQEEVERAARLADAHDFISGLPEGYDAPVGERGGQLSGGQRQRLAIARALLKDAPILILDEATSALDAETEREVQRSLDKLVALERQARRTVLVIAHRLSTIRNADRIVVISGGRVVEVGRHDELVALGGEYARLHRIYEGEEAGEEPRATAVRA
jgi:subfamily B ATP-binding cassette protein MsbA